MSMLDTYRNNLLRKREEAAKLNQDLAKEQAKLRRCSKKSFPLMLQSGVQKVQVQ